MNLDLLLGLALGAAQPQSEPAIIVTGHPLPETGRNLAECLKRHCPPDEDIAASLAHAENLFVAGRYGEARAVTRAALRRNSGHGRDFPLDLSNLYRADGRIAAHLGDRKGFYDSTWGIQRVLKTRFEDEDPKRIGAEIEIGDMYAKIADADMAERLYQRAAAHAASAGREDLVGYLGVRLAWLAYAGGSRDAARHSLEKIAADARPERLLARLSALVLLARLDRRAGRTASSDALIEAFRSARLPRPVLLFTPPIDMTYEIPPKERTNLPLWVDIGFNVGPDGHVEDVEILRSHGRTDWTPKLLDAISARLYSQSATGGSTYRIERYTYTQMHYFDFGSHGVRWGNPQIEYLDLTEEPPAAAQS